MPMTPEVVHAVLADWEVELATFLRAGHEVDFEIKQFRGGDRLYVIKVPKLQERPANNGK